MTTATRRQRVGMIAAAMIFLGLGTSSAAVIDVLWYTGGVASSGDCGASYEACIGKLAGQALAETVGNTWNVTFWSGGDAPAGAFDVLVTVSETGFWPTSPSYGALTAAIGGGLTFGDRIMVSGQDADWHYINSTNASGNHSDDGNFDSSQGFLIDAVNWAGSGTGLGLVALNADPVFASLSGFTHLDDRDGDSVIIDDPTFPINEGLTSAGLSNWASSHHDLFTDWDPTVWDAINLSLDCDGPVENCAVTLVSAETAGGGTTPMPLPGSLALLALGLSGLAISRRTR